MTDFEEIGESQTVEQRLKSLEHRIFKADVGSWRWTWLDHITAGLAWLAVVVFVACLLAMIVRATLSMWGVP